MMFKISDRLSRIFNKSNNIISPKLINELREELINNSIRKTTANKILEIFRVKIENIEKKEYHDDYLKKLFSKLFYKTILNLFESIKLKEEILKDNNTIVVIGLSGAGKTITAIKLANIIKKKKKKKKKVIVIGIYTRKITSESFLKDLGKRNNIDTAIFTFNPLYTESLIDEINELKKEYNSIIIDTTAISFLSEMQEMKKLFERLKINRTLLIIDALSNNSILEKIKKIISFFKTDGVVVSKTDSSDLCNIFFIIYDIIKLPIFFNCTGEKINNILNFDSDNIARKISGFSKNIKEEITELEDEYISLDEDPHSKSLNFIKLLRELENIYNFNKKVKIFKNVSVFKKIPSVNQETQNNLKKQISILQSMTLKERLNPAIINQATINRISKNCKLDLVEIKSIIEYLKKLNLKLLGS